MQVVIPAYEEFFEYRSKNTYGEGQLLRRGLTAASALYHLREHIPALNHENVGGAMRRECPDYSLVADIANVGKHHTLTRGQPQIKAADQVFECLVAIVFNDVLGEYAYQQTEVDLDLGKGQRRELADVLYRVMEMWRVKLEKLGIITLPKTEPPIHDRFWTRAEAESHRHTTEIARGENRTLPFRIRKWNYERERSEPMNLTNKEITMVVRERPSTATLAFKMQKDDQTVVDVDFEVPLNEDQKEEYYRLADEQQAKMAMSIVTADPALREAYEAKLSAAMSQHFGEGVHVKVGEGDGNPKNGSLIARFEREKEERAPLLSGTFSVLANPYQRSPDKP